MVGPFGAHSGSCFCTAASLSFFDYSLHTLLCLPPQFWAPLRSFPFSDTGALRSFDPAASILSFGESLQDLESLDRGPLELLHLPPTLGHPSAFPFMACSHRPPSHFASEHFAAQPLPTLWEFLLGRLISVCSQQLTCTGFAAPFAWPLPRCLTHRHALAIRFALWSALPTRTWQNSSDELTD